MSRPFPRNIVLRNGVEQAYKVPCVNAKIKPVDATPRNLRVAWIPLCLLLVTRTRKTDNFIVSTNGTKSTMNNFLWSAQRNCFHTD